MSEDFRILWNSFSLHVLVESRLLTRTRCPFDSLEIRLLQYTIYSTFKS